MHTFPVCWGLDIGHSSIKAVKLQSLGSTVTVIGYAIEPITVPEDGDRDTAVVQALQHLASREDFGATPVVVALSGRQVFTKTINIPVINPRNALRMVELEARQQVPGGLDDVEWGYHLSPAADGSSNDVALFAVKREVAVHLVDQAKAAGLNLVGISVTSLALYNFIRYDQSFPDNEAIVILDVGAENTDIVVYQGEALWMRTLTVSGNDITRAFMKKFKVSFEEAETLKRQAGSSKQADKIIKVIEGSLGELSSEVQRNLGFYKSQNPNATLENLIISGATFRMPGLPEYFAERLRYTVNILEDLEKIQVAPGLDRDNFLTDLPSLGVAMGLALQGVGATQAGLDLMPRELQLQRILKQKRWAGIALVSVIGITLFVHHSIINSVYDTNETLLKQSSNVIANNNERESKSKAILAKVSPKAQELKAYSPVGAQSGATIGVIRAVLDLAQDIARTSPLVQLPKTNKDPEPVRVLPIMVREITLGPAEIGVNGPFKPFAVPRDLTVVVAIPVLGSSEIITQFRDRLLALPVPPDLAIAWGDPAYVKLVASKGEAKDAAARKELEDQAPKLFSDVQRPSDRVDRASEVSYYIDPGGAVDAQGNPMRFEVATPIPVHLYTLTCKLRGTESAQ